MLVFLRVWQSVPVQEQPPLTADRTAAAQLMMDGELQNGFLSRLIPRICGRRSCQKARTLGDGERRLVGVIKAVGETWGASQRQAAAGILRRTHGRKSKHEKRLVSDRGHTRGQGCVVLLSASVRVYHGFFVCPVRVQNLFGPPDPLGSSPNCVGQIFRRQVGRAKCRASFGGQPRPRLRCLLSVLSVRTCAEHVRRGQGCVGFCVSSVGVDRGRV